MYYDTLCTYKHQYDIMAGDGVSIPCSYTSHLSPVSSAKLHSLVSCAIDKEKVRIIPTAHIRSYSFALVAIAKEQV